MICKIVDGREVPGPLVPLEDVRADAFFLRDGFDGIWRLLGIEFYGAMLRVRNLEVSALGEWHKDTLVTPVAIEIHLVN